MCLRWCRNRCRAFVRALSWCPILREPFLAWASLARQRARSKPPQPPTSPVCANLSPSSLSSFYSSLVSVSIGLLPQCGDTYRKDKGADEKRTRTAVTPAYATVNPSLQQTFLIRGEGI